MSNTSLWLRLGLTLGFMGVLLALSLVPGKAEEGDSVFVWVVAMTPTPLQKAAHLLLYALLAFLWAWAMEPLKSIPARFAAALLVSISFGAAMELAQTHIPGRFGNLSDVLLNSAGALIGLLLAGLLL